MISSRRFFQKFLADGFIMLKTQRLTRLRKKQSKLHVEEYTLHDTNSSKPFSTSKKSKIIVLPSSFVGGKRFMDSFYFDGMSIFVALGFPDLFITFTCNPNWQKIQRCLIKENLKPHDRSNIVTRVFKIKFNQLLNNLSKHMS